MSDANQSKLKKGWVREASIQRLNSRFRNNNDNASIAVNFSDILINQVEESGLSVSEVRLLELWRSGLVSGRHCMIAMLEHRQSIHEDANGKFQWTGVAQRPLEFAMLSSSLNLPEHFLCDSGYLYESVFSRTPGSVTAEGVGLLAQKVLEGDSKLRIDQLNLAIKQLKMDQLCSVKDIHDENSIQNNTDSDQSAETRSFRSSVLVELVRLQIKTIGECQILEQATQENNSASLLDPIESRNSEVFVLSESSSSVGPRLDCRYLETHLEVSLTKVAEEAAQLLPEQLEVGNQLLKPYIKRLASLKGMLSSQLRDLEDTKAYISLGIHKDATDGDIRKAYHSKAIKLHPDKPGGDTALFQKLQANYQEIINKRRTNGHEKSLQSDLAANPKVKEETERARLILRDMGVSLDKIKLSTDKCTAMGQLAIQWLKCVDKAAASGFPIGVEALHGLFVDGDVIIHSKKSKKIKSKAKGPKSVYLSVDDISPEVVADHLETVCDQMQQLASAAMRLPSCGFRYGLCTAVHESFMKTVEKTMNSGLGVMRLMSTLLGAGEQVNSCKNKVAESRLQAVENQQIHNLLAEMVTTAFQTLSDSIGRAAAVCVDAALIASDLYRAASAVVEMGEKEAMDEARRDAEKQERDNNMCEEDRVFMAEKLRRDREELGKQAEKQYEEEQKKEEEEAKTQMDENVEQLRVKIKNLQVQLRVQHVQALQSLNSETRQIQKQLQHQLRDMLSSNVLGAESSEDNRKTIRPPSSSQSSQLPPLRLSLLSLLADFLDCSCNNLRDELTKVFSEKTDKFSPQFIENILRLHLGWMQMLHIRSSSDSNSRQDVTPDTVNSTSGTKYASTHKKSQSSLSDIDGDFNEEQCDDNADATAPNTPEPQSAPKSEDKAPAHVGVKLALLPDYRTKTLWLCCMIDTQPVIDMIQDELQARIPDEFAKCVQGGVFTANKQVIESKVRQLLDSVCEGILAAAKE